MYVIYKRISPLFYLCLIFFFHFGVGWKNKRKKGNSLSVQWLGLSGLTVGALGSIPGQRTKIPQATGHGTKKKKKKERERVG